MKKIGFLVGILMLLPLSTHASTLTPSQVSAIISLLQAFGVDSATIANVEVQLQPTTMPKQTLGSVSSVPTPIPPTVTVSQEKVDDKIQITISGNFDTTSFTLDRPGSAPYVEFGERKKEDMGTSLLSLEPGDYAWHANATLGSVKQQINGVITIK